MIQRGDTLLQKMSGMKYETSVTLLLESNVTSFSTMRNVVAETRYDLRAVEMFHEP